ncbi:hypothetical protein D3C76_1585660 [compost metagenome]
MISIVELTIRLGLIAPGCALRMARIRRMSGRVIIVERKKDMIRNRTTPIIPETSSAVLRMDTPSVVSRNGVRTASVQPVNSDFCRTTI